VTLLPADAIALRNLMSIPLTVLKTNYLETFYIHFDFLCISLTSSEMIGRACEVNTRVDLSN